MNDIHALRMETLGTLTDSSLPPPIYFGWLLAGAYPGGRLLGGPMSH